MAPPSLTYMVPHHSLSWAGVLIDGIVHFIFLHIRVASPAHRLNNTQTKVAPGLGGGVWAAAAVGSMATPRWRPVCIKRTSKRPSHWQVCRTLLGMGMCRSSFVVASCLIRMTNLGALHPLVGYLCVFIHECEPSNSLLHVKILRWPRWGHVCGTTPVAPWTGVGVGGRTIEGFPIDFHRFFHFP